MESRIIFHVLLSFVVVACTRLGNSSNTPAPTAVSAVVPEAFSILSATVGNAQATISWQASSGASSYILKRGTTSGNYPQTVSSDAISPYIDAGLQNGVTYYYMVTAVNSVGSTNANAEVSARPTCTLGGAWTVLDNYTGSDNYATGYGGTIDASGNLFTVGTHRTSSVPARAAWLVRKSTNAGVTWSTVDSFQYAVNSGTQVAKAIANDSSGRLFAAGYGEDSSGYEHWLVRLSTDSGLSWTTVDDFQAAANKSSQALSIAVNTNNEIYVTGTGTLSDNTQALVVRKSTNNGGLWSTVSTYQRAAGQGANPQRISINPFTGAVFIGASLYDSPTTNNFTTRVSTDDGSSWTNLDEYRIAGGSYGYAYSFIFEDATTWTTFGTASDVSGLSHLIARKTTDSGSSWSTVLNETYNGIFYDSLIGYDGLIYSAGYKHTSGWKVRRSATDFSTSTDIDTYNYSGTDSIAYRLLEDRQKNLFVVGYSDSGTVRRLIVRKLACD